MKPSPPLSALVARVRASRRYAHERQARLALTALQKRYDAGEPVPLTAIGFQTMTLWAAVKLHKEAQARYQETLRRREAMPAESRWSVPDIEKWLQSTYSRDPFFATGLLP